MDSLYPRRSFYMEDQKMKFKISDEARVQMPMKTVSLPDRDGRNRDLGFFRYPRKIKSTLN